MPQEDHDRGSARRYRVPAEVEADVWLGNKPRVNLISSRKVISTLSFDQLQLIKSSIQYTKPIETPIIKGNTYGKLLIEIDGKPNIEVDLIADNDVGPINAILKILHPTC